MSGSISILKAAGGMPFLQLLLTSFTVLLVQASLGHSALVSLALSLLYLNALTVTLAASGAGRGLRLSLWFLWLMALFAKLWTPAGWEQAFFLISKGLSSLLLLICIAGLANYLFFRSRITADTLFACIVIYLLIAILFAQLYLMAFHLLPGSFGFPQELAESDGSLRDIAFTYFSFVTIATLGYGDIVPRDALTQMLASIEAVVGQFYVAIVVARLVGLYAASSGHTQ